MTNSVALIIGLIIGTLIQLVYFSIHIPKARTIKAVMLFGKLYTFIANVENKKIYKDETTGNKEKWDIIDLEPNEKQRSNIYFFLWPFFTIHKFKLTYTKEKMLGEETEGDKIIWQNNETKHCLVSRTGISDHLEWRAEYPTFTSELDTNELATIDTFTNNMIEVKNPAKTLFGIKDWFEATNEILHGGLRSLVSKKKLTDLNSYSGEEKDTFNKEMLKHANESVPGLKTFGLILFKSVFKDFNPANDVAKALMNSYANVTIAEKTGDAKIITEQKNALAYEIQQAPIVKWKKKYLIDTGLAKVDKDGNIIELVADANTRVTAEAIKALADLKGTLVMDNSLTKMLGINSTKEDK